MTTTAPPRTIPLGRPRGARKPPWPVRPASGPIDPSDPCRPTLRLLRWPGAELAVPPGDGSPSILGRLQGWPLELRVWPTRPRDWPDAVRHPSGAWVAVRLLDA